MKEIRLTKGHVALVDDGDYSALCGSEWFAIEKRRVTVRVYAFAHIGGKLVSMASAVMGKKAGFYIDHKNGNCLDNRRENLRFCSPSENSQNRHRKQGKTSRFKGVSLWRKDRRSVRWRALIYTKEQKQIHLGSFLTEEEAAVAYDGAARQYFGEFAKTNF